MAVSSGVERIGAEVTGLHPTWSNSAIASWIVDHGGTGQESLSFFGELCERLVGAGIPLFRVSSGILTLHPEVRARTLVWTRKKGAELIAPAHGLERSPAFKNNPFAALLEGSGGFRRRLDRPGEALEFPLLVELRDEGATDYVIMPLLLTDGAINYISLASDEPDGFSIPDLTLLYDLLPLIALRLEIDSSRRTSRTLLGAYLGRGPARRVIEGEVSRGHGELIRAAIWYADMRNFTGLAERWPAQEIIDLLNDYFERLVEAVESYDGEILKFMGDALLAIFPFEDTATAACCRALDAAVEALDQIADLSRRRVESGREPVSMGLALHLGEVTFGNIGAPNRLDFTAIGPAINEVSRLDALCGALEKPLLTSASFAKSCGRMGLVSMGPYALKGVSKPQEIFTLP